MINSLFEDAGGSSHTHYLYNHYHHMDCDSYDLWKIYNQRWFTLQSSSDLHDFTMWLSYQFDIVFKAGLYANNVDFTCSICNVSLFIRLLMGFIVMRLTSGDCCSVQLSFQWNYLSRYLKILSQHITEAGAIDGA